MNSKEADVSGAGVVPRKSTPPESQLGDLDRDVPALRRSDWELPGGASVAGAWVAGTSRVDLAAERLTAAVRTSEPGARLGTKEELRQHCGVSVGTFNEALRLLQSRGLVTVRPGPGGGLFAAEQSPTVRLGNSVLALNADQTSVAEAVRLRDALDPLLVEDALWRASPADIAGLRQQLDQMAAAAKAEDATGFVHANWRLHALIAAVSPHAMLRSIYSSLLEIIEEHTLTVLAVSEQPLPDYLNERFRLHTALVEAIEARDTSTAMRLIAEHSTTARSAGTAAGDWSGASSGLTAASSAGKAAPQSGR